MTKDEVLAAINEEIARLKHARQLLLSLEGLSAAVRNTSGRRSSARVAKPKAGRRAAMAHPSHRSSLTRPKSTAHR
jgi:hypothetical protein